MSRSMSLSLPSKDGPTNPPRLPTELISPILPAAADSVKIILGSAQNAGMYDFSPINAMVNNNTAQADTSRRGRLGQDQAWQCPERGHVRLQPHSAMVNSDTAIANRILNDSEAGINNVQPSATAPR